MKNFLLILISIFCCQHMIFAQIASTREEILEILGEPDEIGTDDNGGTYFKYEENFMENDSSEYTRNTILYFLKLSNGKEVCSHVRMIYPGNQRWPNIEFFNENFELTAEDEWYDQETDLTYWVDHSEPLFSFLIWKTDWYPTKKK